MSTLNGESRMLINGKLVPAQSGRVYDNINPATEEVIGQVADAGVEDMGAAIAAARNAFDHTDWSTNHALRAKCLRQLQDGLRKVREELRDQMIAEVGTTRGVAESSQCYGPIEMMTWTIDFMEKFQWERDIGRSEMLGVTSDRRVFKEPAGVVAAITPWNFPLQINLAKIVPALAAGCTVVLKPAPDTPWSATMIGRIAAECTDMPAGVLNVVTSKDPVAVGDLLTGDPRVDVISFTGSTQVGRHIMARASGTLKKVFLELGGKSANIILDDADLQSSLLSSLGVCYHAGQGCAITTRLLIPESRKAEAEALLEQYFGYIQYGDPNSQDQIMGPLVNARQRERVLEYIEVGKKEGARLLVGGGRPANLEKGYYVQPTVFTDVKNSMRIAQEEIFGPVLCVITYKDDEDAIAIANDSIFGLSGGVWSADPARALRVARRIRTGTVNVNGGNFLGADSPFGGYKQSGIGREMGHEGFEEYLETKTIAIGVH